MFREDICLFVLRRIGYNRLIPSHPLCETWHRSMKHTNGSIEVITGSMFSGKTEELIRRLRRARIARQSVQVFKPVIDNRYSIEKVKSHAGSEFEATPVALVTEILPLVKAETTVVALDEAQFFPPEIVGVARALAARGVRVIVAGLDQDFRGEPFGAMPDFFSLAESVDKLHAICAVCGDEASRTQRLINGNPASYDDPVVVVGASEMYEARCREHHIVPRKPKEASAIQPAPDGQPEMLAGILISEEQLRARVVELGAEISRDYEGKEVMLLCILRGAVIFLTDLMRALTINPVVDFMAISSYDPGVRKSSGQVRIVMDVVQDIEDRHVLVIEDIVDTGHTIAKVMDLLAARRPASLKICALLDKAERRVTPVPLDYVGFTIPNHFVVGYGLDVDEYYRHLPYIGIVKSGFTIH
jgi:thymidine kinase